MDEWAQAGVVHGGEGVVAEKHWGVGSQVDFEIGLRGGAGGGGRGIL